MTKEEIEPQVIAVVAEKLSADKDKISRNTNSCAASGVYKDMSR